MRANILIVVVAVLALVAIYRPKWGLYTYVWFALMRPDILAFSVGEFPYSLVIAGGTLIGLIPHFQKFRILLTNPILWWL